LDRKRQETKVVYAITERDLTAVKNAIKIDNASPIVEKAATTSSLLQRVQRRARLMKPN
jgi:hypothetical protein